MYTHIEVEPNDNCPMSANMVYKNLADPVHVSMVRLYEGRPEGTLFAVTGWSSAASGTPRDAFAVQVEDSGAGGAYVVFGGDWGLRLRPADAAEWSLTSLDQWGETHLVLADVDDIIQVGG